MAANTLLFELSKNPLVAMKEISVAALFIFIVVVVVVVVYCCFVLLLLLFRITFSSVDCRS